MVHAQEGRSRESPLDSASAAAGEQDAIRHYKGPGVRKGDTLRPSSEAAPGGGLFWSAANEDPDEPGFMSYFRDVPPPSTFRRKGGGGNGGPRCPSSFEMGTTFGLCCAVRPAALALRS